MTSKELQRWAPVAAGALVAAAGLKRGGRDGLLLSVAGGALGVLGYLWLGQSPSVFSEPRRKHWHLPATRLREDADSFGRRGQADGDTVHEASEESFPASDAPSFTPNTSIGKHEHN